MKPRIMNNSVRASEKLLQDVIYSLFGLSISPDKTLYEELDSLQILELLTYLESVNELLVPDAIELADLETVHSLSLKLRSSSKSSA